MNDQKSWKEFKRVTNILYLIMRLEKDTVPDSIFVGFVFAVGLYIGGASLPYSTALGCILALSLVLLGTTLAKFLKTRLN